MKRRVWTMGAALTALALMLAACGDGSGSGSTTAAATPSGNIDVWMGDPIGATQQPIVDQLAKDYQAAHPGTTVTMRYLGKDAHQAFVTGIAGGTVPCVALIGNTWSPEFAAMDALEPISQDPKSMQGKYVQGMIDSTVLNGTSYAVPYDVGVRALIYRKDLFDKAGLTAPKTWNELATSAAAVQTANPGVYGFGVTGGALWYYVPLIWNWGGQIATQDGSKWTAKLDSPQAIAAFTFYAELLTKNKLAPAGAVTWGGGDAAKAMALGQLATMVGGSWDLKTILAQTPALQSQLATVPIPAGPGGSSDTFAGGSNLAIFKDCNNKTTAKSFVDFMTAKDNLVKVTSKLGLMPATLDALDQEKTTGSFSTPLLKAYADQVSHTKSVPQVANWGSVEGTGAFVNAMQAIMNGQKTPQAAMQELTAKVNEALGKS
jgi:N,N'-diacetylchitobiose transport system substrate-binding protein